MAKAISAPQTQDEANLPYGYRLLVIIGGFLGLFAIAPQSFAAWILTGIVLVPLTWIKTGKRIKQMMLLSGCSTKQEWKTYVATLPKNKKANIQKAQKPPRSTRVNNATTAPTFPAALNMPPYRLAVPDSFANFDVVGEAWREESVLMALGGLAIEEEKTVEDIVTFLVPEPTNPYDRNAVMVWMNGYHVGYLDKDNAKTFQPVLNKIVAAGYCPSTSGRLWGAARVNGGQLRYHLYARVALTDPARLVPSNNPPRVPYSLIPWGAGVQVTKESDHLAELYEHLNGADSLAIATLHPAQHTLKSGIVRTYVDVRISNAKVGQLTPAMSEKFLPTIQHLNNLQLEAAVWARVKGSALAIEVVLQALKAHEIPAEWLSQIPLTTPVLYPCVGLDDNNTPRANVTEKDWEWQEENL